jgi:D-serine deaminase-like pyridoxal phosphate-dependent protein
MTERASSQKAQTPPNVRAAGATARLNGLETPCIVIDRRRLRGALERMRDIAGRAGVRLRPHVKTHKSLALAALQLEDGGATGICASKPNEALVFIEAGVRDVLLAYPVIDGRKLDRVFATALRHGATLGFIADSQAGTAAIDDAAKRHNTRVGIYLKVDVGLHRVGVDPTGKAAIDVARAMADSPHLDFRGLLSHAGHAYGASSVAEISEIAEAERRTLLELAVRLRAVDITVHELSVGSTPSVLAATNFEGLTEIRPGNYVFLDATALRLGVATSEQVSFSVLATVVSRNDRYAIIDAGSKVLSSDKGAHGLGGDGFGFAYRYGPTGEGFLIDRLSEEHGWIAHRGRELPVGARVRIVPNHSCVVANLVGQAWLVEDDRVVDWWAMEARAQVL